MCRALLLKPQGNRWKRRPPCREPCTGGLKGRFAQAARWKSQPVSSEPPDAQGMACSTSAYHARCALAPLSSDMGQTESWGIELICVAGDLGLLPALDSLKCIGHRLSWRCPGINSCSSGLTAAPTRFWCQSQHACQKHYKYALRESILFPWSPTSL